MEKFKETEWLADLMFSVLNSDDSWLKDFEESAGRQAAKTKKANNQKINISTHTQTQTKY